MAHGIPGVNIEIFKDELNLFSPAGVQHSIEDSYWRTYPPNTTINPDSGPINFSIKEANDYLDLFNSYLKVTVQVVDTRPNHGQLNRNCEVALSNNTLHTLFKAVTLQLGNQVVSHNNNDYPYRAYIETLLSFGDEAKKSYLQAEGYYPDTPGQFNTRGAANHGYTARKGLVQESKVVELIGKLHLDFFNQPLYLLNNTEVRLTLERNKDEFVLHGNLPDGGAGAAAHAQATFGLKVLSASLIIRHIVPVPSIVMNHAKLLSQAQSAKYPIRRVVPTSYTINRGSRNDLKTGLFTGQLPHRITIGIVNNEAYNGSLELNPFNFHHYNLESIQLQVGSKHVPATPLKLDYQQDAFLEGYFSIFNQTGQYGSDEGNGISRSAYPHGNALYCFNLSKDLNIEDDHFNPTNQGSIAVDLVFREALPETVSVIAIGEFDNTIEIDLARNVTNDYNPAA